MGRLRLLAALPLLSWALSWSPGAEADVVDHAREYEICMAFAETHPEEAFESALSWEVLGGATAARHCAAVALMGLGHYAAAATRLEDLAEEMRRTRPELLVAVLVQTGQAWLLAGEIERAHAVQTIALQLDPGNVDLMVDRSLTRAAAENYRAALEDLNQAANLMPDRPDVLIYRASAQRFLGAFDLATADVERALALAPDAPDGLLERGNLRRIQGDDAGARSDWLRILDLAPESPAADAARANLATLDFKVE